MTSKEQQQERKTVPKETTQKGTKKQKTSESSASTQHSERIASSQDSDLTRSTKKLKISYNSNSSSHSDYSLKDVPSQASKFTEEDIVALNATFEPLDENNFISDVEAMNLPSQYLLPEISRNSLEKKEFDVDKLNTSDIYVMQFYMSLHRVVKNLGVDIGTEESKTKTLVSLLLNRAFGFDGWPFDISDKRVSANPGFVVNMKKIAIIVIEDKHLKNILAPDFGEAQIFAKILACGSENVSDELIHQTIYAIRVISSYVTFYKAEIPIMYWKELKRGLPQKQMIKILRWPGENNKVSGLDLAIPKDRHAVFEAITKIRQSLLQSASSTTTSTSHIVTSITALTEQENF
nr:7477_t:CDS:2 [Entrophospora candida]